MRRVVRSLLKQEAGISGTPEFRRSLDRVLWATLVLVIVILLLGVRSRDSGLIYLTLVTVLAGLALNRWGWTRIAANFSLWLFLAVVSFGAFRAQDGLRSFMVLAMAILLLVAASLLRLSWFAVFVGVILLVVAGVGIQDFLQNPPGVLRYRSGTTVAVLVMVEGFFVVGAIAAGLFSRNLRSSLELVQETSAKLQEANFALQKSESMLKTFIDLAPDAILLTDTNWTVLDANERAGVLTGLAKHELVGKPLLSLVVEESRDKTAEMLRATQTEAAGAFVMSISQRGGSRLSVEVNSRRMPHNVIQVICRDITERIQAEQQVSQLQKMESIGRLAGGVAHDFNNLLTVINGYSELILYRLPESDPFRREIEQIRKAGLKGAELAARLLAFSRKTVSNPVPLDLNRLILEHLELLKPLMGEDIQIVTELASDGGQIKADPGDIHSVLMNLAVNARDAMSAGGRMIVSTRKVELPVGVPGSAQLGLSGSFVVLTVVDTGVGMSEETRSKVFEPFFTTKKEGQGTGLGLSTVYGIVKQLGGAVTVESEVGSGATFCLYFPVHVEEAGRKPIPFKDLRETGGHETILLTEDDASVRTFIRDLLKAQGYQVMEAASGQEALELSDQFQGTIDLLLTDVVMEGMNGKELARSLRTRLPKTKVLFMSGYPRDAIEARDLLAEGVAYLPKPFAPEQLACKLREILEEVSNSQNSAVTG